MSLLNDLMNEKKEKVLSTIKKTVPLSEVKKVTTVIVENPDNKTVKSILDNKGYLPRTKNPTAVVYCENNNNKKIASILSKFGNLEV